jgi:hypothetical protein
LVARGAYSDNDDDNKPVWPTWAVSALFRDRDVFTSVAYDEDAKERVWPIGLWTPSSGVEMYSSQSRMFSHALVNDDNDANKPVWPAWAVGALFRGRDVFTLIAYDDDANKPVWPAWAVGALLRGRDVFTSIADVLTCLRH